jgi:Hemerythrin HHE cation binding domain
MSQTDISRRSSTGRGSEITDLILRDHKDMRAAFARLDELRRAADHHEDVQAQLAREWKALATLLDVHAAAEEELVYPLLLRRGENAEEETDDAIRDHNDIRDAVRDAHDRDVGGQQWWQAVLQAREANSEHMAEEEREALPDLRLHTELGKREEIGRRWLQYKRTHRSAHALERDLDPGAYIAEHDG